MRKSIAAFMVLMIFTLSLACTMSFCPVMAHAAQAGQPAQDHSPPPCHSEESSDQNHDQGPMLSSDCLGVDLFYANGDIDLAPDQVVDHIDFAWADITVHNDLRPENILAIRGPPFAHGYHSGTPPLYLTTQRLRI